MISKTIGFRGTLFSDTPLSLFLPAKKMVVFFFGLIQNGYFSKDWTPSSNGLSESAHESALQQFCEKPPTYWSQSRYPFRNMSGLSCDRWSELDHIRMEK